MRIDWSEIHSKQPSRICRMLLTPFSVMYGLGVLLRMKGRSKRRQRTLPGHVVSVGNLTTGGTGKTPAVCLIARWAARQGYGVAVLSRGYGGTHRDGALEVSDGRRILAAPREAGDEPFLLANKLSGVPVVIARKRYQAGMLAHERHGSNFFILDDGFQHLDLHRDVDLVLLNARRPFGNGHLLPLGPLREPLAALGRGDAFVLTGPDGEDASPELFDFLQGHFPEKPLFRAGHRPETLVFPLAGRTSPPELLRERRVAAFSGIARPERFRATLLKLGARIVHFEAFRDHHAFRAEEIKTLISAKRLASADYLVMTEKDWGRVRDHFRERDEPAYLSISYSLEEPEAFFGLIRAGLDTARPSRGPLIK